MPRGRWPDGVPRRSHRRSGAPAQARPWPVGPRQESGKGPGPLRRRAVGSARIGRMPPTGPPTGPVGKPPAQKTHGWRRTATGQESRRRPTADDAARYVGRQPRHGRPARVGRTSPMGGHRTAHGPAGHRRPVVRAAASRRGSTGRSVRGRPQGGTPLVPGDGRARPSPVPASASRPIQSHRTRRTMRGRPTQGGTPLVPGDGRARPSPCRRGRRCRFSRAERVAPSGPG